MLKLCLVESDIPETKKYGEEVIRDNGMVSGNKHSMINYLQKRYNYRLKDFAQKNDILVIGAFLEQCVGWLALSLLDEHNARQVTVDLTRSFSLLEKYKFMHPRTTLSTSERCDILWQNHPELHPFEERLVILK